MSTPGCPKRRGYEQGSGRVPLIVSQHGVQWRVFAACSGFGPALLMLADPEAPWAKALLRQGGIGLGTAAMMVIGGLLLLLDWIVNDEIARVRSGAQPMRALRRRRDLIEHVLVLCWVMLGLYCVIPADPAAVATMNWWSAYIPRPAAVVWAMWAWLGATIGMLAAREDAWRRGRNGP